MYIAKTFVATLFISSSLQSFAVAEQRAELLLSETSLLETIVVTASGSANTLGDTAASIGVIGEQHIEEFNAAYSAELFNRIPGSILYNSA